MSIALATIEELQAEIASRQQARIEAATKQLELARENVKHWERELAQAKGSLPRKRVTSSRADREAAVLAALSHKWTGAPELTKATGLRGATLRKTLRALTASGRAIVSGKARGMMYAVIG